ncbi:DnaJ C-terminal domain-containing protein [Streptomyces nigrescens]
MEFPLTETALGTDKDIEVDTAAVCDQCQGAGAAVGTPVYPCHSCSGLGTSGPGPHGGSSLQCSSCHGSGVRIPSPCAPCAGTGRVPVRRTLTVRIPAGLRSGETLRLVAHGTMHLRGGGRGDLLLHLDVDEDESRA